MTAQKIMLAGGAFVVVLAAVWVWRRGLGGAAEDAAKAGVKVVGGLAAGAVKGTASVVGIPDTDMQKCQAAIASGQLWEASYLCPAGEFLKAGGSRFFEWFQPKPKSGFTWGSAEAARAFEEQEKLFGR